MNSPEAIDFRKLPVEEQSIVLRKLALGVVEAILDPDSKQPTLSALANGRELRVMHKKSLQRSLLGWMWCHAKRILFGPRRGKSLKRFFKGFTAFGVPEDRLKKKLGFHFTGFPEFFWRLVTERAWWHPRFRLEVESLLRGYLKERVLFGTGDWDAHLRPATLWLLLRMTRIPPRTPRWIDRIRPSIVSRMLAGILRESYYFIRPHKSGRLQFLHGVANREFQLYKEWAGFWDQWMIAEMLIRWEGTYQRLPRASRRLVMSMPYVNQRLRELADSPDLIIPPSRLKKLWIWFREIVQKLFRRRKKVKKTVFRNKASLERKKKGARFTLPPSSHLKRRRIRYLLTLTRAAQTTPASVSPPLPPPINLPDGVEMPPPIPGQRTKRTALAGLSDPEWRSQIPDFFGPLLEEPGT